jgi:hypothetical protein
MSCAPFTQSGRCFLDRAQNSVVRAAAAKVVVKRAGYFGPRWRWIAIEQGFGGNENAAEAISALAGLLLEKSLLQGMWLIRRAKSLDGGHVAASDTCDRTPAGFFRLVVDQVSSPQPNRVPVSRSVLRSTSSNGVSSCATLTLTARPLTVKATVSVIGSFRAV